MNIHLSLGGVARRRRTVSRDRPSCAVRLLIAPARRSSVQRLCPCGGLNQQGRFLVGQLAWRPACLLTQRQFHPTFRKRHLIWYTVDPPTEMLLAIATSPPPAGSRIWARFSLRIGCLLRL